jgi:hypothetical protein
MSDKPKSLYVEFPQGGWQRVDPPLGYTMTWDTSSGILYVRQHMFGDFNMGRSLRVCYPIENMRSWQLIDTVIEDAKT